MYGAERKRNEGNKQCCQKNTVLPRSSLTPLQKSHRLDTWRKPQRAQLFPLSLPSSSYLRTPAVAIPVISRHPPHFATTAIPQTPRSPLLTSTPNCSTRNEFHKTAENKTGINTQHWFAPRYTFTIKLILSCASVTPLTQRGPWLWKNSSKPPSLVNVTLPICGGWFKHAKSFYTPSCFTDNLYF